MSSYIFEFPLFMTVGISEINFCACKPQNWISNKYARILFCLVSSRVGESHCLFDCLCEEKLSRLEGLPYLPRRDNSPNETSSDFLVNGW